MSKLRGSGSQEREALRPSQMLGSPGQEQGQGDSRQGRAWATVEVERTWGPKGRESRLGVSTGW